MCHMSCIVNYIVAFVSVRDIVAEVYATRRENDQHLDVRRTGGRPPNSKYNLEY